MVYASLSAVSKNRLSHISTNLKIKTKGGQSAGKWVNIEVTKTYDPTSRNEGKTGKGECRSIGNFEGYKLCITNEGKS